MNQSKNRWKGFVTGMIGSLAGLMAMRFYWQRIAPALKDQIKEQVSNPNNCAYPESLDLDSISIVGRQHREGESATAAVGRILYSQVAGKEPETQETKTMLSYLVHWGYGMFQGGLYGALMDSEDGPDLRSAAAYATGLWLFGDELVVPLLGLQSGPTAAPPVQHLNRWGAHLAYGLATGVTTSLLRRLF